MYLYLRFLFYNLLFKTIFTKLHTVADHTRNIKGNFMEDNIWDICVPVAHLVEERLCLIPREHAY